MAVIDGISAGASALQINSYIVVLPGRCGREWKVRTWASSAAQASQQVCDWQGMPLRFVRRVTLDAPDPA